MGARIDKRRHFHLFQIRHRIERLVLQSKLHIIGFIASFTFMQLCDEFAKFSWPHRTWNGKTPGRIVLVSAATWLSSQTKPTLHLFCRIWTVPFRRWPTPRWLFPPGSNGIRGTASNECRSIFCNSRTDSSATYTTTKVGLDQIHWPGATLDGERRKPVGCAFCRLFHPWTTSNTRMSHVRPGASLDTMKHTVGMILQSIRSASRIARILSVEKHVGNAVSMANGQLPLPIWGIFRFSRVQGPSVQL